MAGFDQRNWMKVHAHACVKPVRSRKQLWPKNEMNQSTASMQVQASQVLRHGRFDNTEPRVFQSTVKVIGEGAHALRRYWFQDLGFRIWD